MKVLKILNTNNIRTMYDAHIALIGIDTVKQILSVRNVLKENVLKHHTQLLYISRCVLGDGMVLTAIPSITRIYRSHEFDHMN